MLKRFLFAVAAMGVCSTSIFAQDVFVTFGEGTAATNAATVDVTDATGTAFVFVRSGFEFDGFQVDLASSDNSVARVTAATVVNSNIGFGGTRFNNADVDLNSNGALDNGETGDINSIPGVVDATSLATIQATSINQNGIISAAFASFDGGFDADANAFLLARIDYDIVGAGEAVFSLQTTDDSTFAGPTGFLTIPEGVSLDPVFGSATLTVEGTTAAVPEPSSAALLALGFAGFAARRRR